MFPLLQQSMKNNWVLLLIQMPILVVLSYLREIGTFSQFELIKRLFISLKQPAAMPFQYFIGQCT